MNLLVSFGFFFEMLKSLWFGPVGKLCQIILLWCCINVRKAVTLLTNASKSAIARREGEKFNIFQKFKTQERRKKKVSLHSNLSLFSLHRLLFCVFWTFLHARVCSLTVFTYNKKAHILLTFSNINFFASPFLPTFVHVFSRFESFCVERGGGVVVVVLPSGFAASQNLKYESKLIVCQLRNKKHETKKRFWRFKEIPPGSEASTGVNNVNMRSFWGSRQAQIGEISAKASAEQCCAMHGRGNEKEHLN